MTFDQLLKAIPHTFAAEERKLLERALEFARKAHEGQKRKSGEDYIEHPMEAAIILGQIFPDPTSIAALFLHDILENTPVTLIDVEKNFGKVIADLVDGVTKLGSVRLRNSKEPQYVETLRKMFIATSKDVRVIMIKLADRIHNIRTLQFLPENKQKSIATETLEMYAPIANRLGIYKWKNELEDRCFAILDPVAYEKTKLLLEEELKKSERGVKELQKHLSSILRTEGHKFLVVDGRVKRVYSLYKKVKKYGEDFPKHNDIIALRIVTRTTADCYACLGAIHTHFQPVPDRIKDYISTPKPNGYQSLHTAVFDGQGGIVEIQIRTDLMHEEAERGVAAHWFYTEQGKRSGAPAKTTSWIHELRAWQEHASNADEFFESLKIDFFKDRIFVLTPKGDAKDLPTGAIVIDFAFGVHSDLGYHMMGAKINGKMSKITDTLKQGDVIEILKSKQPVKISRDWLRAARTSNARNRIRTYLAEHDKSIMQRVRQLKLQDFNLPTFFRKK